MFVDIDDVVPETLDRIQGWTTNAGKCARGPTTTYRLVSNIGSATLEPFPFD